MIELKLKELKTFTWEDVGKHNTRADCWVVLEKEVDGKKRGLVLDITSWAPRHPGGSIIYDGAGGDCSIMFWSYHPLSFIDNCNGYLNKYVIGEIKDYKPIYDLGSTFHRTLKRRVEEQIPTSISRSDWRMWFKSFLIVLANIITFYYGWIQGSIIGVFLLAFFMSQGAVNLMHDGSHASFSKSSVMCEIAGFAFNVSGGNYLAFRRQHAFGHHAYTNHLEHDFAFDKYFPIVKLHWGLKSRWFHLLQHIYIIPVYLFGILRYWFADLSEVTALHNFPKREGPLTRTQWAVIASGKIFFILWYIPLHFSMFDWPKACLDCLIFMTVGGCCSVVLFAVNHWTEKAAMFSDKELTSHTSDWAILQIISSTNFAVDSWLWTHVSGALNLQIEHHLFPGIIHTRLPLVKEIVQKTCAEYGIDYDAQCYPSFTSAFLSNLRLLRNNGLALPGFNRIDEKEFVASTEPRADKKKHA